MNTLSDVIYPTAPARDVAPVRSTTTEPIFNYRAQMVIAYRHYLDKDYNLALATYRRVLSHFPADAIALSGEAWSLYYLGQDNQAAVDFRTLLHANSSDSWARKGLALCEGREAE